jgi:hypothetical protein
MIEPLAEPLRRHIESLSYSVDRSNPIRPEAFDLVERASAKPATLVIGLLTFLLLPV